MNTPMRIFSQGNGHNNNNNYEDKFSKLRSTSDKLDEFQQKKLEKVIEQERIRLMEEGIKEKERYEKMKAEK
jgi:hypothetical protein